MKRGRKCVGSIRLRKRGGSQAHSEVEGTSSGASARVSTRADGAGCNLRGWPVSPPISDRRARGGAGLPRTNGAGAEAESPRRRLWSAVLRWQQPLEVERLDRSEQSLCSVPTSSNNTARKDLGPWLCGVRGSIDANVDRRTAAGRSFVITDGGVHHMLAVAAIGALQRRNYPIAIAALLDNAGRGTVAAACPRVDLLAEGPAQPADRRVVAIFCAAPRLREPASATAIPSGEMLV